MEKLNKSAGQSMDIVADNIAKLKELFPEILTENKIDFDTLKALLGEEVETEDERYSFNWHGKVQARQLAQSPSTGTLRPCKEDSVDWDATQNLFIEGDNLEVLKLLQKSYHKQVKLIYIDPPYNTGKDFVYPDNFRDNIHNYLELTGQIEDGKKTSPNTEASGRYHTVWLNMIYPRLKLAKNLLSDDGIILVSLDDTEISNLRQIMNEIFGEEMFVGIFSWRSRTAKADVPFGVSNDVEWVIAYAKPDFIAGRDGERKYYKSDDHEDRWRLSDLTTNKSKDERPNSFFLMVNPKNGNEYPASEVRTWAVTTDTFSDYYKKNKIVFPGDYEFLSIKRPAFRVFEKEDKEKAIAKYGSEDVKMSVSTYLPEKEVGRTEHGSKEIRDLFVNQVFSFPKPTSLIRFFVENFSNNGALILDFFAGSATTAHATMNQNISDSGSRKYILVQLPEKLDPNTNEQKTAAEFCKLNGKPQSISEISKERIRRAAKKIKEENPEYKGDLGFKVFKLDSSNLKPWDANFDSLAYDLAEATEVVKAERSAEDVLFEILLKYGLDLTLPIETHTLEGKTVYEVGAGALVVCLDSGITEAVAEAIGKLKETLEPEVMRVVFKDSGFANDAAKVNAVQVLKQFGIDDVKSI